MAKASLNVTIMTNTFEAAMSCSRGMCDICSNIFRYCSDDLKQHCEYAKSVARISNIVQSETGL